MVINPKELDKERLGKIVRLARGGVGGERDNAVRMVRRICATHGLDFDEVMNGGPERHEYAIRFKSKAEERALVQVVCRYALLANGDNISHNRYRKVVIFETTVEKYFETLHAWDVLRPLYAKEMRRIQEAGFYGFLDKHRLYYQPTPEEREQMLKDQKISKEEMELRAMGAELSQHMSNADIHKRLGN